MTNDIDKTLDEFLAETLNAYLSDRYDSALPSKKAYLLKQATQILKAKLKRLILEADIDARINQIVLARASSEIADCEMGHSHDDMFKDWISDLKSQMEKTE